MAKHNLSIFDSQRHLLFTAPAQIERDMHMLMGAVSGVICDQLINAAEKEQLEGWLLQMSMHLGREPYDNIIGVVRTALADGVLTLEEKDNILWLCSRFVNEKPYYDQFTRDLQKLSGVIYGIVADRDINEQEVRYLDTWIEEHSHLQNCWPYDEVCHFITHVLTDGKISTGERQQLLSFFDAITANADDTNESLMQMFGQNFYQIDPKIIFEEQTFCITGLSKKYKRKEIAESIILKGGFVTEAISGKTNYLIVCSDKNQCWAYSSYGRKIEEAMMLRKKGKQIAIVHEFDLYDVLE
jgi:hypothetical protein